MRQIMSIDDDVMKRPWPNAPGKYFLGHERKVTGKFSGKQTYVVTF